MNTIRNHRSHRDAALTAALALAGAAQLALDSLRAQTAPTAHYTVHATGATEVDGAIPLRVSLRIDAPPGERTVFEIPVWTPGSYRLREFPERIGDVQARVGDRPVPAERLNRTAWQVRHGKADGVELSYSIAIKAGDRFLDPAKTRRCITYEGPAVYLYARGLERAPCHIRFDLPAGWSPASGLQPQADGSFFAADYDVLADCPVKLGVFQKFSFQSHGAQVEVILDSVSDLEFDSQRWLSGLQAITDEGGAIFGGLPCDRYVFLFTAGARADGGGLEHLNSTAIGISRNALRRDPASTFGIAAHEFFHVWNVKRLRPIELGPFFYDRPNRTTGLWLAEGVTSYYGDVLQARAGQMSPERFWQAQAAGISDFESTPGRAHTSLEQASFRVWDKQAPDRVVDYYGGGQVIGLLLDLEIRAATKNGKSLDDAMVAMLRFCEEKKRGLTADEIVAVCSQVAGTDLGWLFDQHVRGTVVPDYERILGHAGWKVGVTREPKFVLRGANFTRAEAPAFSELSSLERSGGGDPMGGSGLLRQLDDAAVTTSQAAQELIAAAAAAGKRAMKVEFELPNGARRTVTAAIEERVRVRYRLEDGHALDGGAAAVREGITKRRRP
ncbi:MAG: M61 family metallopeptidase [Planctomycetes bacterium]|nr:M61 family metallopeptidase [Planctomycetota bacterium]